MRSQAKGFHKNTNFPSFRDAACNRERPVQNPHEDSRRILAGIFVAIKTWHIPSIGNSEFPFEPTHWNPSNRTTETDICPSVGRTSACVQSDVPNYSNKEFHEWLSVEYFQQLEGCQTKNKTDFWWNTPDKGGLQAHN